MASRGISNGGKIAMKKYITLVFEYENDKELAAIREVCKADNCRAWSMDHEMMRTDLIRQAIEDKDLDKAQEYLDADSLSVLVNRGSKSI